jgi:hypothetical protein
MSIKGVQVTECQVRSAEVTTCQVRECNRYCKSGKGLYVRQFLIGFLYVREMRNGVTHVSQ